MEVLAESYWMWLGLGVTLGGVLTALVFMLMGQHKRPTKPMELAVLDFHETYNIRKTDTGIEFWRVIR